MEDNLKFINLYYSVKDIYPDIVSLSDQEIENIKTTTTKDISIYETNIYLKAALTAIIFFISLPFCFTIIDGSLSKTINYFMINRATYSMGFIETINISLGIGIICIITYFYLMLSFFPPKHLSLLNKFSLVDRSQKNFIIWKILCTYIAILFIGFLLYLNINSLPVYFSQFFKYFLIVPFLILIFLFLIFSVMLFSITYFKIIGKEYLPSTNTRITICEKLLIILKGLNHFGTFYFIPNKEIRGIIFDLKSVSTLIKSYPISVTEHFNKRELDDDFLKAGIEFEKNIINIIVTNELHSINIKKSLIVYLNTFLSGDLLTLPKAEIYCKEEENKKVKLIHFILFGVYLTLPILIMFVLKLIFKISLDDYFQSILKILYIIWACFGIFLNPFILNNENKELLKDIIKTIFGKG